MASFIVTLWRQTEAVIGAQQHGKAGQRAQME